MELRLIADQTWQEEKISESEDCNTKINSELWDNSSLMCVIGIPEGKERQVENKMFKETMAEIFIYLTKYLLSICVYLALGL